MSLLLVTLLAGLRLAPGERPEDTVDTMDSVPPDEWWAWQSLMQVNAPKLWHATDLVPSAANSTGADASHAKQGSRLPALVEENLRTMARTGSGLAEFTGIVVGAMGRVANQSFDPFSTPITIVHPFGREITLGRIDGKASSWPDSWEDINDVWPNHGAKKDGDEGLNFFTSAPPKDWLILGLTCVVLFFVDLFAIQRMPKTFKVHILTLFFWFVVALAFNAVILVRHGRAEAFDWCTGYFLEWILSLDNLFVFHLVFETYKTPANQTHKAVFLGIIGAVVIRMLFFMAVSTLLHYFQWVRIPFGLLLIWSGIQAAREEEEDEDVSDTVMVKAMKWLLGSRLRNDYDDKGRVLVRDKHGYLQVTLLAMVIALLELSDVIFALDSVSAKIAQIPDQYMAFSSTVLAMFGLRAMFFIVKDLVDMFELLRYGLCFILVFIGIELIFAHYVHLPSGTVCLIICSVFVVFTLASVARNRVRGDANSHSEFANEDTSSAKENLCN